jgi:hypothetical protein
MAAGEIVMAASPRGASIAVRGSARAEKFGVGIAPAIRAD